MFDLMKLTLLAAGCVVFYGFATGADLNELFAQVSEKAVPVAKEVFAGLMGFITDAMKKA